MTTIHSGHALFSSLFVLAAAAAVFISNISTTNAFVPTYKSKSVAFPTGRYVEKAQSSSTSLAGIGSVISRVRDSVTSKERSRDDLKIGIAGFYDRSSKLWEEGQSMLYIC
jgi:hypothetical protein